MKTPVLILCAACVIQADPRIDNVLVRMVPPGSVSLVGAHMDQLKTTAFYKRLIERNKMYQVDAFARETGFDPRRDVRELLFANTATGGVLLARGTFPLHADVQGVKPVRYGVYTIRSSGGAGFCVLDATLAVAGDIKSIESALDEWTSGSHAGAQPLLARVRAVDPQSQFWGVSVGFAGFLADNLPHASSGLDFSRIFRGLEDTWFQAGFAAGFQAVVHGSTATEQDAVNLRDAAKGLIGFGRLSVPENRPEMLKLWDGVTVEQEARNVTIRADIPQDLVDRVVDLLGPSENIGGRGRGRGLP